MKQHEVLHQLHELKEAQLQKELKKKKHACQICPFKTIQKSHLERHMTFHNKENFNLKKGYYTCEYCKYYSTNTGKMKQHEVLHTQEWEALIEEVATADVESGDTGEDESDNDNMEDGLKPERNCVQSLGEENGRKQCDSCEGDGAEDGEDLEEIDEIIVDKEEKTNKISNDGVVDTELKHEVI